MKLKVAALTISMSMLGFINPSFAEETQTTTETTTTTTAAPATTETTAATDATATPDATATVKKHHGKKHHHHHAKHHTAHHHAHHVMASADTEIVARHDYKDMGALAEVCPRVDVFSQMLDMMGQNVGRAKSTVDCMKPLSLAGGINFDSRWGARNAGYAGVNSRRFALNDAYANIYGNVNDWVQAFMSLSFSQFSNGVDSSVTNPQRSPNSSASIGRYSNSYAQNQLQLEQGTITFKNMNVAPIFIRVGKEFTDFGRYLIHPMTETMSQVMSESLKTQIQAGFLTAFGFNGSIYTFNNDMVRNNTTGSYDSHAKNNWGGSLNFTHPDTLLGFNVGAAYMYDFTGVDQVAYAVGVYNGSTGNGLNGTYRNRVSAGTIYGDLNTGPFTIGLRFVSALQRFNVNDLGVVSASQAPGSGAQPWALDITGGFGFNAMGMDQNIYLGYQGSHQAVNLFLPRNRWMGGYGINVLKNTNLGVQLDHDVAYSTSNGGTGNNTNRVTLRAGVMFG